jgi:hypothetical protein
MKLFIPALLLPFLSFAQLLSQGSIHDLIANDGFSEIKLGSDMADLPAGKVEYLDKSGKMDKDSCYTYAFTDEQKLKIDSDFTLDMIAFRAYKNKIVNVYLFFQRSDGYKLLRYCISNYGLFTSRPNDYADVYEWKTDEVNLSLRYQANSGIGIAIFTNNPLQNKIIQNLARVPAKSAELLVRR